MLQTRSAGFVKFKVKLQQLIEELFLPTEDEGNALTILGEMADAEYVNLDTGNNTNDDKIEDDKHQKRRKSFSEGLCEKTLKARFGVLDEKVLDGYSWSIFLPHISV